ncbi:NAD(P)/FAD-dependent oxidoreductase [Oceanobacillus picturae]|uniref:NAD(P)/FAD-dependent oxidoreductase n=1 Tax=Oceanobacillus picturae TaxID=171693 RepID=UPI0036406E20
MTKLYDVVIVGAGPSGIGVGSILKEMGCESFVLLEKGQVGESFRKWPKEMRFITPSFPAQGFGQTDLNAVVPKTSPAYTLDEEHPTGDDYAEYLALIHEHFQLPVRENIEVISVDKESDGTFTLRTSDGEMRSKYVVWSAGEYHYPNLNPFSGANLGIHTSSVSAWEEMDGEDYIIIGGYESGLDAAYHLCNQGADVKVIARTNTWELDTSDPSVSLTPYTYKRLKDLPDSKMLELIGNTTAVEITKDGKDYVVHTDKNETYQTSNRPIIATGFSGGTKLIKNLATHGERGEVLLTEDDELQMTKGIYLAGPEVRHGSHVFCYIYKFRQRYAVVATSIAKKLGLNQSVLDLYRQENFILDDLSMCGERCQC